MESLKQNSLTQYVNFMHANGSLPEDARVAAVTTQIYQESIDLDLASSVARKFGITKTQAAGIPSPAKTTGGCTPAAYLSEILRILKTATLATQHER